jgi:hypothetical protein
LGFVDSQRGSSRTANGQSGRGENPFNFGPAVPMKDAESPRPMLPVVIILATLCLLIGSEELVRPAAIRRKRRDD